MIFERPLDELVEKIGGDQFVDICTGKVHCEWLGSGEY